MRRHSQILKRDLETVKLEEQLKELQKKPKPNLEVSCRNS